MISPGLNKLSGKIEVDETFCWRKKHPKKDRDAEGKQKNTIYI